ncbi:nuclease-related domain-containing protein [Gryllotalpicola ginsengisoli]|uniref:nuclease-related domain-containing protein n=1 Tax=Gryllotalpicola ginsengisoli TaxID=444608 RepID=UPI00138B110F|nr:nuclease-related domain-containing protein [Gryllotalpicola ginsengisoli]
MTTQLTGGQTTTDTGEWRVPAASVIVQCLSAQAEARQRGWFGKLVGASPLTDESRKWYVGALGELRVARELDKLGPEWTVLHAIPAGARGRDIDHLVVGPGGVFTINTKCHEEARVWVAGAHLRVNGVTKPYVLRSRDEATDASLALSRATGANVSVRGVIAFVAPKQLDIKSEPDDVSIVSDRGLLRFLRRQRAVLSASMCAAIVAAAEQRATWRGAGSGPTTVDRTRFDHLRDEVDQSKLVRGLWGVMFAGAMVVVGISMLGHG